ncbi:MAG: cob(I)yrinic acid a,c-diamide adenosyltransferase [Candidatus Omnitrophota bacterium]|nr:cob(I)yrinic acid a,c-diamide adenosyltransferase [Candidatus Omnitrophota bacterium]
MSIVTKKGDGGKTSLYCGKTVGKDDPRIEMCGAIDEVSSFLGVAKNSIKDRSAKRTIHSIQKDLIVLGAEVATSTAGADKIKKRIDKNLICVLEKEIEGIECKLMIRMNSFCIPGNGAASSALDVARAVTRRAERRGVTLFKNGKLDNPNIIAYLNRLSDLLYLLARASEKKR